MSKFLGTRLVFALVPFCTGIVSAAPPVVSNVTASQRADGSGKVDIYYDLSDPDDATLIVAVRVSQDAGATWTVPVTQLSGDAGSSVSPGPRKHIVWESCASDLPGVFGTRFTVLVEASDSRYTGEMIWIPAGPFLMGNNGSEPYSHWNEFPQHEVYLSGYWIGKFEVTRGQYRRFIESGGYANAAHWSAEGWNWRVANQRTEPRYWAAEQNWGTGKFTQTDDHPVVGLTYYEAEAFCRWAGGALPTEAQWEKAARWTGAYPNVYPWGNVWDPEKCNNFEDHNSAGGGYRKYQTAPVGSYPGDVSPYGCMDMGGNVIEWCQDWFDSYYYRQAPPGGWIDPKGPASGLCRAMRGASWNYPPDAYYARCSARPNDYPYITTPVWNEFAGVRLAR